MFLSLSFKRGIYNTLIYKWASNFKTMGGEHAACKGIELQATTQSAEMNTVLLSLHVATTENISIIFKTKLNVKYEIF